MGIYGLKALSFQKELNIEHNFQESISIVYDEYINYKNILESCKYNDKKIILEQKVELLCELSFKDLKDKIIDIIKFIIEKLKQFIDNLKSSLKNLKEKVEKIIDKIKKDNIKNVAGAVYDKYHQDNFKESNTLLENLKSDKGLGLILYKKFEIRYNPNIINWKNLNRLIDDLKNCKEVSLNDYGNISDSIDLKSIFKDFPIVVKNLNNDKFNKELISSIINCIDEIRLGDPENEAYTKDQFIDYFLTVKDNISDCQKINFKICSEGITTISQNILLLENIISELNNKDTSINKDILKDQLDYFNKISKLKEYLTKFIEICSISVSSIMKLQNISINEYRSLYKVYYGYTRNSISGNKILSKLGSTIDK